MATGLLDAPGVLYHEELNVSFGFIPDYFPCFIPLAHEPRGRLARRSWRDTVLRGWSSGMVGTFSRCVLYGLEPSGRDNHGAGRIQRWCHCARNTGVWIYLRQDDSALGIGALIGGALMGVVMSFPAIKSALRSLATAAKTATSGGSKVGLDEMPLSVLIAGTIGAIVLFFGASMMTEGVSVGQAILASVVGVIWLFLAGLIVAQATGMTDISPMSGMALISVTLAMFLLNNNVAAAMVVGIAVCVAIGQGADMMQDLKTGYMIGGRPVKQQIAQFCVTWMGASLAAGAIHVLFGIMVPKEQALVVLVKEALSRTSGRRSHGHH